MDSQLIHGKFIGENSGYLLVACTPNIAEEEQQQLCNNLLKKYHFWGSQGIADRGAVGVFLWQRKQLVLVKAALAKDENGNTLMSGSREFEQHHYVFIPQQYKVCLETQAIDILIKLFDELTPYFSSFNQPIHPYIESDISWEQIALNLLVSVSPELTEAKGTAIKECWNENDEQEQSFFQLALATILNHQKFILTIDNENTIDPIYFVSNLLLLLPARDRTKIAIAIGSVDEQKCPWADIIVKTDIVPKRSLLPGFIWLNRSSRKVVGNYEQSIFEHRYLTDFINPIREQPQAIFNLIKYLHQLTSNNQDLSPNYFDVIDHDLTNPRKLIYLIAGLPEEEQDKLWSKYIPEIYDNWQSNNPSQSLTEDRYWQTIVDDFCNSNSFWQGLINIFDSYNDQSEHLTFVLSLMLMVLSKLSLEQVQEKLEDIKGNHRLSYSLSKVGLLDQLSNITQDNINREELIKIYFLSVEYISKEYLASDSNQELIDYIDTIAYSHNYQQLFSSLIQQFSLIDNAFKQPLSSQIITSLFNQRLAAKLPYKDRQFIQNSNLYRQLQQNFSQVANYINSLLQSDIKDISNLPKIAKEMEMTSAQIDSMYSHFLNEINPPWENALPLVLDIVQQAIKHNYANTITAIENQTNLKEYSNSNLNYFSHNLKNYSKTLLWLKNNSNELKQTLDLLESMPEKWHSWYQFTSYIFKKELPKQVEFLDHTIANYFTYELLIKWLEAIGNNSTLKFQFLQSNTCKNLNPEIIIKLLTLDYKKWTISVTSLLTEHNLFTDSEQLKTIIPTLLNCLKKIYFYEPNITNEDKILLMGLTKSVILSCFTNKQWIELLALKWKLDIDLGYLPRVQPFTLDEEQDVYSYAIEKLNNLSTFEKRLNLLNECYLFKLPPERNKMLAIKMIQNCINNNEIASLLSRCESFDFNVIQKLEILENSNFKIWNEDIIKKYTELCIELRQQR